MFNVCEEAFLLPPGASARAWKPLISAVTGHHGAPPRANFEPSLRSLNPDYGKIGIEAAREFVGQVRELFELPLQLESLQDKQAKRASHAVAGLAVLADWIGSNQEWFPYCEPKQDLQTYWSHAKKRAELAVEKAGVLSQKLADRLDYEELIGSNNYPSPMQHWAGEVDLPVGSGIISD